MPSRDEPRLSADSTKRPSPGEALTSWLAEFRHQQSLPETFADVVTGHYLPLAHRVMDWRCGTSAPLALAVNGAQGTGKSTLAACLASLCEHIGGLRAVVLSLDDFYLTKGERERLGREVHALFQTRGVPGTHDLGLGQSVVSALLSGQSVRLPAFDKSIDDRRPESQWPMAPAAVDLVILEGWCVGCAPQPDQALAEPANDLERSEDPSGLWRRTVNEALANEYAAFFGQFEKLVMLRVPDFECVYRWRGKQEAKLRARVVNQADQSGVMDAQALARFIQHYERLTRWMLVDMPDRADVLLQIQEDHTIGPNPSYQRRAASPAGRT